jgi:large subunit ribosomal protein L28
MAVKCVICEKIPKSGMNVSHSLRHTKRRWMPNLQTVRAEINGKVRKVTVCTRCLRSNKVKKVVS